LGEQEANGGDIVHHQNLEGTEEIPGRAVVNWGGGYLGHEMNLPRRF
jgi:hypothetical protein